MAGLGDTWAFGKPHRPFMTPRKRRWSAVAAATAFFVVALSAVAVAAVWTDKADYSPGETVTISGDNSDGAGYLPGEIVVVNVSGPNGYEASCEAVADENGAWSCQVTLWDSALAGGDYTYTATGQNSGTTESGVFTDATYKITTAALEIRKGDCSAAQSTFTSGDTVCARATVTGTTTGSGTGTVASDTLYVRWFDASNTLKFSDDLFFAADGSQNVTHAVTVTSPETWTVKACNNPNCLTTGTNKVFASATFNVTAQTPTNTAPSITSLTGPTPVDESGTAQRTYSFSFTDPDADTWSFVSGYPTCGAGGSLVTGSASIDQVNKSGEFKCIFDDGPASPTVAVKIFDGTAASNEATLAVAVSNVPPTITALTPDKTTLLVGEPVTFTGTATDPSNADTTAGFQWSFNGGDYGSANTFTTSFSTCGTHTISATAKDKDEGVSDQATSSPSVTVYDAQYLPPLVPGQINKVQKGQVIPVKVTIGCGGFQSGLSPQIRLLTGDIDPNTGPNDDSAVIQASVSNADTSGVMREVDGQYIYNMRVPDAAKDAKFTIRVNLGGGAGGIYVVIQIRK